MNTSTNGHGGWKYCPTCRDRFETEMEFKARQLLHEHGPEEVTEWVDGILGPWHDDNHPDEPNDPFPMHEAGKDN